MPGHPLGLTVPEVVVIVIDEVDVFSDGAVVIVTDEVDSGEDVVDSGLTVGDQEVLSLRLEVEIVVDVLWVLVFDLLADQ